MDYYILLAFIIGLIIRQFYKNHEPVRKYLNLYLIYFGLPLMVLVSLKNSTGLSIGEIVLIGTVYAVLSAVIIYFIVRKLSLDDRVKASVFLCSAFGNTGYLGIPMSLLFFGNEGAAIASILTFVTTFVHFSLGVVLSTSYTHKHVSPVKSLLNPLLFGIAIAFIISKISFDIPAVVTSISAFSTYLMMLVIGLSINLQKLSKTYVTGAFLRFILSPIVMLLILLIAGLNKPVFVLIALMPAAFSNVVLAIHYKFDDGFASKFTSISTLAFVVVAFIVGMILGV